MIIAFAKYYYNRFKLLPIFIDDTNKPLHEWKKYADSYEEYSRYLSVIGRLYSVARNKAEKEGVKIGIALATGAYQATRDVASVVVDIDRFPEGVDRKTLAVKLAELGYPAVYTVRGLHIHFMSRDKPYMIVPRIEEMNDEGELIYVPVGEGAAIMNHNWTSPPTKRYVNGMYVQYRFVRPDGKLTSSIEYLRNIELPERRLSEVSADLYDLARITLAEARPLSRKGLVKIRETEAPVGDVKYHLFTDMDDFVTSVFSVPMVYPLCIAVVMLPYFVHNDNVNYFMNIMYVYGETAVRKLVDMGLIHDGTYTVREGYRFLLGAAFVLTITALVDNITWNDIEEVLSVALENYPADSGTSLREKLSYLLLSDGRTLYPRYSRLGSIGAQLQPVCRYCMLRETCQYWGSPKPSYAFLKVIRAAELSSRMGV